MSTCGWLSACVVKVCVCSVGIAVFRPTSLVITWGSVALSVHRECRVSYVLVKIL
jgi:hypothetical protein